MCGAVFERFFTVYARTLHPFLDLSFLYSPLLGSVYWFLGPPDVLRSGWHKAQGLTCTDEFQKQGQGGDSCVFKH